MLRGALALALLCAPALAERPGYLFFSDLPAGKPYTVTYDNRSVIVAGQRTLFASAGVHYPRFTPGQWDDVILKAKNDGYNMIQTYVFVNAHAPKGEWPWSFEGPANLHLFLQKVAAAGLFVNFRIGPYVCAEWSWGGYPYNLAQIPGVATRSSNAAWEAWMRGILLNVTAEFRGYFADRGGPIVLAQVENELHTSDTAYIDFCGALVEETGTAIPWEMCNGVSAANTINSCNSGDCTSFIEENGQNGRVLITQPALWTENWMGWFAAWSNSGPAANWPSYDSSGQAASKAAGILRWFARGGSHINQYNWAGGNHFGRSAGSSMVNAYYWDAPLASDNLAQGPERAHIAAAFAAVAAVAAQLLAAPAQKGLQVQLPYYASGALHAPDSQHVAYEYPGAVDAAFLENRAGGGAVLRWRGLNFSVAGGASQLALANGSVLFDSAAVAPFPSQRVWAPAPPGKVANARTWRDAALPASPAAIPPPTPPRAPWVGSALGAVVAAPAPLEAVAFSEYDSELVYYATPLAPGALAAAIAASASASNVTLTIASARAQAWAVFVNGDLVGTGSELSHSGGTLTLALALNLSAHAAAAAPLALTLLSSSLGIDNGGGVSGGESSGVKGVTSAAPGAVALGGVDLTRAAPWTHICGSAGEALRLAAAPDAVPWAPLPPAPPAAALPLPPLTWLRADFTTPPRVRAPPPGQEATASLNLDATGLSRGRFFVNGMDLGRYWSKLCGGAYMCQRYYSIPLDLLREGAGANTLLVLDELGAPNASALALAVSENAPPPPPPPCGAPPQGGGPAGAFPCGSTYTALAPRSAGGGAGGGTLLALAAAPALCLAVAPGPARAVVLAACNASSSLQAWALPPAGGAAGAVASVALGAGLALDVLGQNASVGAALDMWAANGGSNQAWQWVGGELRSALTGGRLCAGLCVY